MVVCFHAKVKGIDKLEGLLSVTTPPDDLRNLQDWRRWDIKQAAIIYDEIFKSSEPDKIAIWLLKDRKVVDSKVVLPFILKNAWQKKIIVFKNRSHALPPPY